MVRALVRVHASTLGRLVRVGAAFTQAGHVRVPIRVPIQGCRQPGRGGGNAVF